MRVHLHRSLLLAAALLMLVLSPGLAQAQNGTITGVLTDSASGQVLSNANVEVRSPAGTIAGRTLSNANGRYQLSVAPGTYNLRVQIIGYEALTIPNVTVQSGSTTTADGSLREAAFNLDPIVVSASKEQEKATDAPAHVEVVGATEINNRPATTVVEHLRGTPGVDIITQGVQSTNVVVRGFNNIFSGALYTLTDNRMAGVPSLRVNVMHFVPTTDEDLQRMEIVLGPGSALYGPNTANGVLHLITKSPLTDPGTTFSIAGGSQDLFQGTLRTAHRLSDRVGVKVSGSYLTATEFGFVDPDEASERLKFVPCPPGNPTCPGASATFFRQDMMRALGIDSAEAVRRISLIGNRDNDVRRWSGEGRVDFQVTDDLTTVLQAGITNNGSGIELTGLGAGQVQDWNYSYYQARATMGRGFAQVYLNKSNAGDTYLLRSGQPIVDESTLLVGQLQHGVSVWDARQNFTYGLDYFYTNPQTKGTINGLYEDVDETKEVGGYLQSQTALSRKFDLVLAGRVDKHDALPDAIFSPRAALVFKPVESQAVRVTYNRAFSTPTSLNQFLDLGTAVPNQTTDPQAAGAARLGYSVRVQGTGIDGFHFRQPDSSYVMRTPALLGGPDALLPANAALFFPSAVGVVAAQTPAGALGPNQAAIFQYLGTLRPTATDIGTMVSNNGTLTALSALNLADIDPIRESTTTTFETGYKGVIANRLSLSLDGWWSRHENLVTPLTVLRPLVLLNGTQTVQYLVPRLMADLGMSVEQATAIATGLAPGLASVPVGVITTPEVHANGAQFLATYTNVDEELEVYGMDFGAEVLIGSNWSAGATVSLVSDDHFDTESVGTVTLNAPKRKGSLSLNYRDPDMISGELRLRYNDRFPVQSGVYRGTACIDDAPGAQPCVKSFTLLDASMSYTLSMLQGAQVQFSVNNVLDEDYQSFIGVPSIGRMALLRLRYTLQ